MTRSRGRPPSARAISEAMRYLGRLGGKSKSEAKAEAARENGKKGGRPRKVAGFISDVGVA
jgi:hypothetical protein